MLLDATIRLSACTTDTVSACRADDVAADCHLKSCAVHGDVFSASGLGQQYIYCNITLEASPETQLSSPQLVCQEQQTQCPPPSPALNIYP